MRGIRFHQQMTQEYFDIFVDSKIKLFSHKDDETKKLSESLLGEELSLKKIFNNRDDNTKNVLWHYLHLMYLMVESAQKKQNKEKIKKISKLIENNEDQFKKSQIKLNQQNKNMKDPKTMIKEMFNVEVNEDTNDIDGRESRNAGWRRTFVWILYVSKVIYFKDASYVGKSCRNH